MRECRGRAPARAALAGNPSDGYGGAVLAVAVEAFAAEATVVGTATDRMDAQSGEMGLAMEPAMELAMELADPTIARTGETELVDATVARTGETELVDATVARFCSEFLPALDPAVIPVVWNTTIPRSVGLGGSSAIVLAVLRALSDFHAVTLTPDRLAELALSIEVDDLGIAAGMQDRIAQSYGGVTFMDCGEAPRYERLDGVSLPPLLVAWREDAAEASGVVHGDLRERHLRGEAIVLESMAELAALARRARGAVLAGDRAELARCADASFDARARMLQLNQRHVEMIEVARRHGAGANYTGSGGAVICVCEGERHRDAVALALGSADCSTLPI